MGLGSQSLHWRARTCKGGGGLPPLLAVSQGIVVIATGETWVSLKIARGIPTFLPTSLCGVLVFLFCILSGAVRSFSSSSLSHATLSHTQLCHTQLFHTQHCHTQLFHTQLFHTQLFHTQLRHTHTHNSFTHNFVTHTHNSFTHNFVTHTHTHTTLSHTTSSHTTSSHTHNVVTHAHLDVDIFFEWEAWRLRRWVVVMCLVAVTSAL